MSVGQDTVYLTIQEDGEEIKYLKNINVGDTITYDLDTDKANADPLTVNEVMSYVAVLKTQEPNTKFVILT